MSQNLEDRMREIAEDVLDENSGQNQFAVSQTPFHTHNNSDSPAVSYPNLTERSRYIIRQVIGPTTANTVASTIGGTFIMPFDGTFTTAKAFVDTAGVTGTMTITVLLNGVSIFVSTLILSILTTATASNTVIYFAIPSFVIGDALTINVTGIQSTPAQGLTVQLRVNETSQ